MDLRVRLEEPKDELSEDLSESGEISQDRA
jgi:hypothetical protein